MEISTVGKWIMFVGFGIILLGFLIWIGGKIGLPLGKLPGDIYVQKKRFGLYFPFITSLIISLILTVIINLIIWLSRR